MPTLLGDASCFASLRFFDTIPSPSLFVHNHPRCLLLYLTDFQINSGGGE
jgi:hypothetical protein